MITYTTSSEHPTLMTVTVYSVKLQAHLSDWCLDIRVERLFWVFLARRVLRYIGPIDFVFTLERLYEYARLFKRTLHAAPPPPAPCRLGASCDTPPNNDQTRIWPGIWI